MASEFGVATPAGVTPDAVLAVHPTQLYEAGAELVITGHEHNYERFAELDGSGAEVAEGLREIVVGTGGAGLYDFGTPLATSEVRDSSTFGVLKLTLHDTGYEWEFISVPHSTFTDSGSGRCH